MHIKKDPEVISGPFLHCIQKPKIVTINSGLNSADGTVPTPNKYPDALTITGEPFKKLSKTIIFP